MSENTVPLRYVFDLACSSRNFHEFERRMERELRDVAKQRGDKPDFAMTVMTRRVCISLVDPDTFRVRTCDTLEQAVDVLIDWTSQDCG